MKRMVLKVALDNLLMGEGNSLIVLLGLEDIENGR